MLHTHKQEGLHLLMSVDKLPLEEQIQLTGRADTSSRDDLRRQ